MINDLINFYNNKINTYEDLKFLKNNRDKHVITGLEALELASLASFDGEHLMK